MKIDLWKHSDKWKLISESSVKYDNYSMKALWYIKKMICESSMNNEHWSMKALWNMKINLWKLYDKWKLIYESSLKYNSWSTNVPWNFKIDRSLKYNKLTHKSLTCMMHYPLLPVFVNTWDTFINSLHKISNHLHHHGC